MDEKVIAGLPPRSLARDLSHKPSIRGLPRPPFHVALLLLAAFAPAMRGDIISNGSFETVSPALATNGICTTNQAIYPSVSPGAYPLCSATGWSGNYQIGNGSTIGVFGVSFGIPQPEPNGSNALILQAELNVAPTATQLIALPTTGLYTLSFYVANRTTPAADAGPQTVSVLLDNAVLAGGTYGKLSGAWTLETLTFSAVAGNHALTLEGLDETSGLAAANVAAFVDDVSLVSATVSVPEPSSVLLFCYGLLATGLARRWIARPS